MTPPDEHDLLLAYLHRELPADVVASLERRLKTEPALADALVMLAREESILTEWSHSSAGADKVLGTSATVPTHAATRPWHLRAVTRWGTAAAVLALAVFAAFRFAGMPDRQASAESVVVEAIQGDVTLETTDGDVAAADGQSVLPGQVIRTGGDDSFAVLRYPDNTRLLLAAWTWVRVESPTAVQGAAGKRVFVGEGQLTAEVARPMLLQTPHAEVRSDVGRFNCSSAPAATRVEPEEGRVRFTGTSDGSSIDVQTGFYAVATDLDSRVAEPFTPRSLTAPLIVARATLPETPGLVQSLAFSPDGRTLVTGSNDGTLRFWDTTGLTALLAFKAHGGAIRHLEFAGDGRSLVTSSTDRRPKVFDAERGQEKLALRKHRSDADGAAFSPDGRMIATIFTNTKEGGEVRFWQTTTGQELGTVRVAGTQILALDYAADGLRPGARLPRRLGAHLATHGFGRPRDGGGAARPHRSCWGSGAVAFSPRGDLVASAGVDGTARLWGAADGREHRVLTAHVREVRSVAFSHDGRFLVTAGNDSTARLWRSSDGREILTVKVRKGAILRAVLSPDGKTLVTASQDRTVRLWDLEPEPHAAAGFGNALSGE